MCDTGNDASIRGTNNRGTNNRGTNNRGTNNRDINDRGTNNRDINDRGVYNGVLDIREVNDSEINDNREIDDSVIYKGVNNREIDDNVIYKGVDNREIDDNVIYKRVDNREIDDNVIYKGVNNREIDDNVIYKGVNNREIDDRVLQVGEAYNQGINTKEVYSAQADNYTDPSKPIRVLNIGVNDSSEKTPDSFECMMAVYDKTQASDDQISTLSLVEQGKVGIYKSDPSVSKFSPLLLTSRDKVEVNGIYTDDGLKGNSAHFDRKRDFRTSVNHSTPIPYISDADERYIPPAKDNIPSKEDSGLNNRQKKLDEPNTGHRPYYTVDELDLSDASSRSSRLLISKPSVCPGERRRKCVLSKLKAPFEQGGGSIKSDNGLIGPYRQDDGYTPISNNETDTHTPIISEQSNWRHHHGHNVYEGLGTGKSRIGPSIERTPITPGVQQVTEVHENKERYRLQELASSLLDRIGPIPHDDRSTDELCDNIYLYLNSLELYSGIRDGLVNNVVKLTSKLSKTHLEAEATNIDLINQNNALQNRLYELVEELHSRDGMLNHLNSEIQNHKNEVERTRSIMSEMYAFDGSVLEPSQEQQAPSEHAASSHTSRSMVDCSQTDSSIIANKLESYCQACSKLIVTGTTATINEQEVSSSNGLYIPKTREQGVCTTNEQGVCTTNEQGVCTTNEQGVCTTNEQGVCTTNEQGVYNRDIDITVHKIDTIINAIQHEYDPEYIDKSVCNLENSDTIEYLDIFDMSQANLDRVVTITGTSSSGDTIANIPDSNSADNNNIDTSDAHNNDADTNIDDSVCVMDDSYNIQVSIDYTGDAIDRIMDPERTNTDTTNIDNICSTNTDDTNTASVKFKDLVTENNILKGTVANLKLDNRRLQDVIKQKEEKSNIDKQEKSNIDKQEKSNIDKQEKSNIDNIEHTPDQLGYVDNAATIQNVGTTHDQCQAFRSTYNAPSGVTLRLQLGHIFEEDGDTENEFQNLSPVEDGSMVEACIRDEDSTCEYSLYRVNPIIRSTSSVYRTKSDELLSLSSGCFDMLSENQLPLDLICARCHKDLLGEYGSPSSLTSSMHRDCHSDHREDIPLCALAVTYKGDMDRTYIDNFKCKFNELIVYESDSPYCETDILDICPSNYSDAVIYDPIARRCVTDRAINKISLELVSNKSEVHSHDICYDIHSIIASSVCIDDEYNESKNKMKSVCTDIFNGFTYFDNKKILRKIILLVFFLPLLAVIDAMVHIDRRESIHIYIYELVLSAYSHISQKVMFAYTSIQSYMHIYIESMEQYNDNTFDGFQILTAKYNR